MRSGCSLVILAGGLSRRMGRDKATLPAGDGTLIEHLARRLAPMVDETIIAGGPRVIYAPWEVFSADPEYPWGADVAVTGEEYVLLSHAFER